MSTRASAVGIASMRARFSSTHHQLGLLARNEEHTRMAKDFNLMDCFECGSCSFVCPAHIPLVQQFRTAKAAVRKAGSS